MPSVIEVSVVVMILCVVKICRLLINHYAQRVLESGRTRRER